MVIKNKKMHKTFEDRLEDMSSATLEVLATTKDHLAEELESQGKRSKNNSRVAIRIRMILEQRGYYASPTVSVKSSIALRRPRL